MKEFYWDVRPGFYVNYETGERINPHPFPGTTEEWYRTLRSTVDKINEKHMDMGISELIVSRDMQTIIECDILYRPRVADVSDSVLFFEKIHHIKNVGKWAGKDVYTYRFQRSGDVFLLQGPYKKWEEETLVCKLNVLGLPF